jgi:hypothetical protein
VPVWTSELYVSDWWQPGAPPLTARVQKTGGQWSVTVENLLERKLTNVRVVVDKSVYELKELAAAEKRTETLSGGKSLVSYVQEHGNEFQAAINSRRSQFGDDSGRRIRDLPKAAAAASYMRKLEASQANQGNPNNYYQRFIAPEGFDLGDGERRQEAVVFAWDAGNAPAKPLNQFTPRRTRRDTLYRITVPALN